MIERKPHEPMLDFLPQSGTWDDSQGRSLALGCATCPWLKRCGGLHVAAPVFDCLSYCSCEDRSKCDAVCPNNPDTFVNHVREVRGFDLGNVPRAPELPTPALPPVIPYVQHGYRRNGQFTSPSAAIPLYKLYDLRTGKLHVRSKAELAERFRIDPSAQMIATGVDRDFRVESWWEWFWTDADRLKPLRDLGVALITVPNFSLFTNVPRHDNFHAMKRIALSWAAVVNSGVAAALHINARTPTDYRVWLEFIRDRPEVRTLAFEFGTGCGSGNRIEFHVDQLCALARGMGRPLTLILRGGSGYLAKLRDNFAHVAVIETAAFRKTMKRMRGTLRDNGRVKWEQAPTNKGAPLDELLAHNSRVQDQATRDPPQRQPRSALVIRHSRPRSTNNADGQPRQTSFLR